jgi:hypothetical protein
MTVAKGLTLTAGVLILTNVVYGQSQSKPRQRVASLLTRTMRRDTFSAEHGPQPAETLRMMGEGCPECIVTMLKEKADDILILEHEGGKGIRETR